jgi:hypothetical protein
LDLLMVGCIARILAYSKDGYKRIIEHMIDLWVVQVVLPLRKFSSTSNTFNVFKYCFCTQFMLIFEELSPEG